MNPVTFPHEWDKLNERFEWIRAMRDVPQDPIFHAEGDVWIHTKMVAEAMAKLTKDHPRHELLHIAALLHDVAKPHCTREEGGRITSKGHSSKGAKLARQILWRLGMPFADRELIVGLIRHHQAPFWLLEGKDDPVSQVARISHTTRCDDLALLAEADARGRTCEDQRRILDNVALFVEYAKERECLSTPLAFPSEHARFLYFANKQSDPTHRPHEQFRATVTVMSGFPGSGKNRWIAKNAKHLPVVSMDQIREDRDVDPTDNQGTVVQLAREEARVHLREGRDFVWNATNISRRNRGTCLRLLADYNARVRLVYVEVSEKTLRAQNRNRSKPVPDHVIDAFIEGWEMPDITEAHELITSVEL